MRQAGGGLSQRGQALGAARVGLGAAQLAIRLFQFFREILQTLHLPSVFHGKAIDQNRRDIKEKHADGEDALPFGGHIHFLHRREQKRQIGERCNRGPRHRAERTEVDRGAHHWQEINWEITAVDSDLAGVIEEQGGQQDLEEDTVSGAALRQARDHPALKKLGHENRKQDQLFVDFVDGREKRQATKKNQPNQINPIQMEVSNCGSFAVQHSAGLRQSLTRVPVEDALKPAPPGPAQNDRVWNFIARAGGAIRCRRAPRKWRGRGGGNRPCERKRRATRDRARIRDATSAALREGLQCPAGALRRNVPVGTNHRKRPPPAAGSRSRAEFHRPRWRQLVWSCWIKSASANKDRKGSLPELFQASSATANNVA